MFKQLSFVEFVIENRVAVELTAKQANAKVDVAKTLADSYIAGADRYELVRSGISHSCSLTTHRVRG
jgi:hypothetical protein